MFLFLPSVSFLRTEVRSLFSFRFDSIFMYVLRSDQHYHYLGTVLLKYIVSFLRTEIRSTLSLSSARNRNKSDVLENYQTLDKRMETQDKIRIKILQSDRGGEYLGTKFTKYLAERGTTRRLTVHDTPSSNGISERCNGILADHVRSMLIDSDLPKFLWGEATKHAMWVRNRVATRHLNNSTPYEARYGSAPV